MKKSTAAATFLFLLLALSCKANAARSPDPVLDSSGKLLRAGVQYHILQRNRGPLLGLTLAGTRNRTCPLDVVRVPWQPSNTDGLPVVITPVNPKKGVVRVSTDVNVKFAAASICVQSTVWKLDNYDEARRQWFITTGGVEGNPGRETISNWFKIEKVDYDYKLVFCPTVCKTCKVMCRDIGLYSDGDQLILALSDFPLRIFFKKA